VFIYKYTKAEHFCIIIFHCHISWGGLISSSGGGSGWASCVFGGFGFVLLIPCQGRFICPLAVAGAGRRSFLTKFSLRLGALLNSPCLIAFRMVLCLGLNMILFANCTVFLLLVM